MLPVRLRSCRTQPDGERKNAEYRTLFIVSMECDSEYLQHFYTSPTKVSRTNFLGWDLSDGYLIRGFDRSVLRAHCRAGLWLRASTEAVMTLFYAIGAVVSLLLFVYLVVALLKPELFS